MTAPVIVENTEQQPDPPEDYEAVHVTEHHHRPQQAVDHQQHLTEVKTQPLIPDTIMIRTSSCHHLSYLMLSRTRSGRGAVSGTFSWVRARLVVVAKKPDQSQRKLRNVLIGSSMVSES